ncbi:ARM repeat superfamily protein [Artemisia annua]|uniref:ARM repeat superfamily protein n=1 Tax=Artemisia annua TaxID=35608 RepID=A0A2U1NEB7_ARTAN|nr:ARM repeat superfamily protein [Artemisia annua]
MYRQQAGGWLFKLNFLVLYFTSIGDSNKNATVNLKFLQCIDDEYDIPNFDWCSYIVECLVRAKKSWVRTYHYTGLVIVLLFVIYWTPFDVNIDKSLAKEQWPCCSLGKSTTGDPSQRLVNEKTITTNRITGDRSTKSTLKLVSRFPDHPDIATLHYLFVVTSLALDADATERIGGTGWVLKELFNIFFREGIPDHVRIAAGEALGMLAFESTNNCLRVFKLKVTEKLVNALEKPLLRINTARIYSGSECFQQLRGIITAASTILKEIMTEENKLQEVMVGLAAHVFRYMTSQEASAMFKRTGIQESDLATALVQILKKNPQPQAKTPRIRRYVEELAIWMMKDTHNNIQTFKYLGMQQELEGITETTAEIESFDTFSRAIGLSRYKTSIHSLVETAVDLLENN